MDERDVSAAAEDEEEQQAKNRIATTWEIKTAAKETTRVTIVY